MNDYFNISYKMEKLSPKKHLGQHFLTDKQLAQKIVRTLQAPENATIAEIGPGMGILTQYLLPKYPNLKLVEIDTAAVEYLTTHFAETPPQIIHQDVLKWNPAAHLPKDSFLIGNLPYNISSPIFFHILENKEYVQEGVFMIQKEVAERICAPKGSKTYGILSVLMQYFYEMKYEFSVPPQVFSPPPKVMSGVIRMVRRELNHDISLDKLKSVVKTAFNQRRKTLRNALKGIQFSDFEEKETWMNLRAEQLGIEAFVKLAEHIE